MSPAEPLRLITPRLALVVPGPAMARRMARFHVENREHLARWSPPRSAEFFTAPWWQRRLALSQAQRDADAGLRLVLLEKDALDGPVIGECNFNNVVRGCFQACHLGYSMDHRFEGRGLMAEALRGALAHVFEDLRLHRVMANHRPENTRSERLLATLGFVREGLARDYLFIDGAWRDHVLTSLVNPSHPGLDLNGISPGA